MRGTVSIYDKLGVLIESRKYGSVALRNYYIQKWKGRFGKYFLECFIQIAPIVSTELVGMDGMNLFWRIKRGRLKI